MHTAGWEFEFQINSDTRLDKLLQPVPFEKIANDVSAKLQVLCCHPSQVGGTGYRRPVYSVFVGTDLFDQFFNSSSGYRGEYFRSPWAGLQANAIFMSSISKSLIRSDASEGAQLTRQFIRESLATPSAKVWLTESGKELVEGCPGCKGEWISSSAGASTLSEIRNGRWDVARGIKSEWGRKAPYLSKLRIMGAFL